MSQVNRRLGSLVTVCTLSPLGILNAALRPVPALKHALGVAGMAVLGTIVVAVREGEVGYPFLARTFAEVGWSYGSRGKVLEQSRRRYGRRREIVETKIARWGRAAAGKR